MNNEHTPRMLSYDERHAAEAAFAGRPFNPQWSARARTVYDGIVKCLPVPPPVQEASAPQEPRSQVTKPVDAAQSESTRVEAPVGEKIPFYQAIETGALIDVSAAAKELGLSFPVTVTKPLWETGIAPIKTLTQEEKSARLRDVLMAFRLRLATRTGISPLIDFPALLAVPPGTVPQPVPLFALIQPDEDNRTIVTLLLPTEVATTIIPTN